MASDLTDLVKLEYEIFHYSSYSTCYLPENILQDCPSNQSSRWSSNTNNPPQYLTLKLKRPAIVKRIKFGKFEKSHVCNLKKFKIFGGLEEDRMVLLLEGGLNNDSTPETFNLRHTSDYGERHPILYLQIMPLLSWGPSFNFSIWYVELHGQDDPMFMGTSLKSYNRLREVEIVRLCLKHFRQQGYDAAFKALQEQTNIRLEHSTISELYNCLVDEGDFKKAEDLIGQSIEKGLMDEFLSKNEYRHSWKLQETKSSARPGTRGGHQLVIDTNTHVIYLFGGWDGFTDLSDLWYLNMETNTWNMIYERSEKYGGPTPRSCHKMVFDPVSGNIFTLGRYLDNSIRTTDYVKSDFYLYDTYTRSWLQICDDTSQVGGPHLVYDHQMCIDIEKRIIYVFGGKILTPRSVNHMSSNEPEYSGLFSYHIATNTWIHLLVDCHHPSASLAEVQSIKSRVTHCMVFHSSRRKLYIYGGQRGKEDIDEFISYNVDTQSITVLNADRNGNQCKNEPPSGYTQRATIDCERDEIYIFSSLSKQKDRRDAHQVDSSNSFWVYSIEKNAWSRIYTYKHAVNMNPCCSLKTGHLSEPLPRYAHQLVYDDAGKVHYLFGGNPGIPDSPSLRLDDFWVLYLEKPKREEILRHCKYMVRKLKFEEIVKTDPVDALHYLQNSISEVIDHSDPTQLDNFHKLASLLFKNEEIGPSQMSQVTTTVTLDNPNKSLYDHTLFKDSSLKTTGLDLTPKTINSEHISPSDSASYTLYKRWGGKKTCDDYLFELKSKRTFLFNTIVQLLPTNMVQPKGNLSDFVLI